MVIANLITNGKVQTLYRKKIQNYIVRGKTCLLPSKVKLLKAN